MALGSAVGDRGDRGCPSGVIIVKAELLPVEKTVPQVLVVAWARVPYGSYWHSCDVLPEGRRPRGHSHNCANNSHMVTREAQATTNLLPVPGKVRLSKLPKPQPARCTLFPRIQLSVPHGIYWHTSYGVLRVCYFTLLATRVVVG